MASSTTKLPLFPDKNLPDAPIALTPLRKHSMRSQFDHGAEELVFTEQPVARPSQGRVRWILTFPALAIMLLTFFMATILLLYLTVIGRVHHPDSSALYLSEPTSATLLGLTITTISTHIVSISSPFLISVAAYCVAGTWLQEQEFPRHTQVALPTPLQYAFMLKVLATPNITSVWQAGQYMNGSRKRLRFPRAFHIALILTSLILGLSYLLVLTDIWLHGSSSVVEGPPALPLAVRTDMLNVPSNTSLCADTYSCPDGTTSDHPNATQPALLITSNDVTARLQGRYPLAPVMIYLYLLYTYAFTAGGIYLCASRMRATLIRSPGRTSTSALHLAQVRLTDPLALVAALYPRDCPAPEDGREMFPLVEDERATGRLEMGAKSDGVSRVLKFGVYRRAGPGAWGGSGDGQEMGG